MSVPSQWVTTALGFDGYRITHNRGVVRGITVRSRNLIVNVGAWIQTLIGGNITLYTELCERTRQEAFDLMRTTPPPSAPTPWSPCATMPTRSRRA